MQQAKITVQNAKMFGTLEYFAEDVSGQQIVMFEGKEGYFSVRNLYTVEEAVVLFGEKVRGLVN